MPTSNERKMLSSNEALKELSPSLILMLLLINLSSKLIFNNDNVEYYTGLFIIYICNLNSVLLILWYIICTRMCIQWRNRNHLVWLSHFTDSTIGVQMTGLWNQSSLLFMAHRSIHSSLFRLTRLMTFWIKITYFFPAVYTYVWPVMFTTSLWVNISD